MSEREKIIKAFWCIVNKSKTIPSVNEEAMKIYNTRGFTDAEIRLSRKHKKYYPNIIARIFDRAEYRIEFYYYEIRIKRSFNTTIKEGEPGFTKIKNFIDTLNKEKIKKEKEDREKKLNSLLC